ncbi:hypothetical protein QTG54_014453 [Skeletonema marinoi]|uniref:Uncharacterized protein n=1 Tax=Skeletonema marinoi TaxID=267567 RepID=A0AAD8XWK5_9STRA|nr:hypothetical protein QTG54_014453 [Skeletonema marinoi]
MLQQMICRGCDYANKVREIEARLQQTCPFCRHPTPTTRRSQQERNEKSRKNDPVAIREIGMKHCSNGTAAGLGMRVRIIYLHFCIGRGKVLRRTRKRNYSIWKRLQLRPSQARYDLACHEGEMKGTIEQSNISSLLPTSDVIIQYKR